MTVIRFVLAIENGGGAPGSNRMVSLEMTPARLSDRAGFLNQRSCHVWRFRSAHLLSSIDEVSGSVNRGQFFRGEFEHLAIVGHQAVDFALHIGGLSVDPGCDTLGFQVGEKTD